MLDAAVIQRLVLLAFSGIVVARPSSFNQGAEPSRLDVLVTDPTAASQSYSYTTDANLFDEERSPQQPLAELAPAQGLYYHNVVYDLSGSADDYDGLGDAASAGLLGSPTYYPPAYAASRYSSSAAELQSLQQDGDQASRVAKRSLDPRDGPRRPAVLAHSNVPFTLGYTREDGDWRPAARRYVPHRPVSSHELPPFTAVRH